VGAEVVEVDGAVGVDDEGCGGGGQEAAEVAVRAPVDEEAAERAVAEKEARRSLALAAEATG